MNLKNKREQTNGRKNNRQGNYTSKALCNMWPAIKIGKKNEEEYKIVDSKRDTIQSQEARDFEIRRYINSNHFIFYYHKALANLGRSI